VATLVRWEPFRELATLQTEMSRLMNGLVGGNGGEMRSWVPTMDAWETENEIVYEFDLPGVPEDKISVELQEDTLTVSAERERSEEHSDGGFVRYERRFGSLSRTVGVPQGVTEESIKASYNDGVLQLRIAKPEAPKPRRIQIAGDQKQPTIEGSSKPA
jgi:HSP20 family protein